MLPYGYCIDSVAIVDIGCSNKIVPKCQNKSVKKTVSVEAEELLLSLNECVFSGLISMLPLTFLSLCWMCFRGMVIT